MKFKGGKDKKGISSSLPKTNVCVKQLIKRRGLSWLTVWGM
jgi:hypothetical protein